MRLTLNSVFTNWKEDGIFKYLDNLNVPWKGVVDYKLLDLDFHSQHGQKIISTTVYNSITTNTGLTQQERQSLADLCFLKYNHKWEGWWNSLELETTFKPLANTDWKETITTETSRDVEGENRLGARTQTFVKGSQTDNQTIGEQTTTESERTNTVGAQTNTQENKVSAFNSSTYQPDKSSTDNTGARTDTIGGGSVSNSSRSDSQTEGERTDTNNQAAATDASHSSEYEKTTVTTERAGNIGVTTSGQLLSDYRTAVDFGFFEKVYADLCNTLVIDIFETCFDDLEDYVIKPEYVLPPATASQLGGIKVGRNLSVESDGTLNAQAEAGDVKSVNGKTGIVVLTNEDVNAPSLDAFNNLATSKQDKIVTEGFENGTFYGIWNGVASFREVMQVPGYDGLKGQVLTKGDGVRYEWKDSVGGVIKSEPIRRILNCTISQQSDNSYFNINGTTGNDTELAVFDVSNYVGCDYEFSALSKYWYNSDDATGPNRMRCAFVDNIIFNPDMEIQSNTNIQVTKEHGCYVGIRASEEQTNTWNVGNVKVPAYGCSFGLYQNWGNTISGIIPAGSKYFLAYISSHWDDAKVRNGLVYDFRIFK